MQSPARLSSFLVLLALVSAGCASTQSKPASSAATTPATASATPAPLPAGWIALFNGRDLTGWKPFLQVKDVDPAMVWTVKDGVLICEGKPVGYIATKTAYTSFELELEWRFDAALGDGNSGVLMRIQDPDKVWPRSVEAQLQSKSAGDIWNIGDFSMKTAADRTEGRHTGKMKETNEKPLGEWNKYRIILDGGQLELWVNGILQNTATDVDVLPGRIGLQSEGAHIEFRNIRIKPLDGAAKSGR